MDLKLFSVINTIVSSILLHMSLSFLCLIIHKNKFWIGKKIIILNVKKTESIKKCEMMFFYFGV